MSNGVPHDIEIDGEVAVRKGIAHFVRVAPRQFRVCFNKLPVMLVEVIARFTNNFDVTDYGVAYPGSYRHSLGNYSRTEFFGECIRRQNIDGHAEQLRKLTSD